jgi:hypothetical protein
MNMFFMLKLKERHIHVAELFTNYTMERGIFKFKMVNCKGGGY